MPSGFALDDALLAGSALELVGAKRDAGVAVDVRLRDSDGLMVRTWTRAIVFGAAGEADAGVLGRRLRSPR